MHFKEYAYSLSDADFAEFYRALKTRSDSRAINASEESLQWVFSRIDRACTSLADVGCGNGNWLKRFETRGMTLAGCDLHEGLQDVIPSITYVKATAENLPFPDKSFDIVSCFHVLEHVRDLTKAIRELKRVARKQLFVIVPRQRYYKFTFDDHLNFFNTPQQLHAMMRVPGAECKAVGFGGGDLVYCAGMNANQDV